MTATEENEVTISQANGSGQEISNGEERGQESLELGSLLNVHASSECESHRVSITSSGPRQFNRSQSPSPYMIDLRRIWRRFKLPMIGIATLIFIFITAFLLYRAYFTY
ncbi:unnamed protein product [Orchesella dallaii]|uniref:Uncharacterized protein n=1 Tax=Orchesella dallaii TaxID=48710 RepID=A0ABP1Q4U5_9HEXA